MCDNEEDGTGKECSWVSNPAIPRKGNDVGSLHLGDLIVDSKLDPLAGECLPHVHKDNRGDFCSSVCNSERMSELKQNYYPSVGEYINIYLFRYWNSIRQLIEWTILTRINICWRPKVESKRANIVWYNLSKNISRTII